MVARGTVDPSAESGQKAGLHPFPIGQNRALKPCRIWVYPRFYDIMIGIEDSEGTVSHEPIGTATKDGASHRRPGKREYTATGNRTISNAEAASLPVGVEQLSLFDEAEKTASRTALEPTIEQIQGYQRKKQVGERAELLQDLPHEKQLCQVQDRCCDVCHSELVLVGEEFVRTEVEFIPARVQAEKP